MNGLMKKLLFGLVLAGGALAFGGGTARADDYWNRHWGWYDNTYRPYYYRNNYYGPGYAQPGYAQPGYYRGGYYSRPYYRSYQYGPSYYRGGGVQVGPLQFGWW